MTNILVSFFSLPKKIMMISLSELNKFDKFGPFPVDINLCNLCLYTITGVFLNSVDRYNEESEDDISTTESPKTTPSLEGKMTETTESAAEPVTYSNLV
jgi:hypothetical protein